MEKKISHINVGWGEGSLYFEQHDNPTHKWQAKEITETDKWFSPDRKITIYRGITDGKINFEIEAGQGITITYS
jgi:hypothetical protein